MFTWRKLNKKQEVFYKEQRDKLIKREKIIVLFMEWDYIFIVEMVKEKHKEIVEN